MEIKTIKQALKISKDTIEDFFGEKIDKIEEKDKAFGIIHTKYSIFLICFASGLGKIFKSNFPDLSNQIMWDEGVKISKNIVLDFINMPNIERKKLSILFVLKSGEIFQISPISLLNFCEVTKLELEENGVYYVFPTIFLKKLKGLTSAKEKTTRDKLSIISQINSLEDFDEDDAEYSTVIRDFDVDFFGEIIRTLRNIEKRLESIENYFKRKRK